jgi:hypothetical protein
MDPAKLVATHGDRKSIDPRISVDAALADSCRVVMRGQ